MCSLQIPFLVYGCFALTVLIFELRRIRSRRRGASHLFPYSYPLLCSVWVCVLAWGTALDNARIFIGGVDPSFSAGPVMKVVTYLCFFLHDVLLPPAIIAPTELMLAALQTSATNPRWTEATVRDLVRLVTAFLVVGLSLVGLNQFMDKVPDKLVLTQTEFPRPFHESETFVMHSWGLTAKATQLDLLGVMVLSAWSLVASFVVMCKLRWPWFFLLQAAALAGQAAGPVSATYFFFASNFWEQVFLASLTLAGVRIWDRPIGLTQRASIQTAGGPSESQRRTAAWAASGGNMPSSAKLDSERVRARAHSALAGPFSGHSEGAVGRLAPSQSPSSLSRSDDEDDDVFHDAPTGDTPRVGGRSGERLQEPLLGGHPI